MSAPRRFRPSLLALLALLLGAAVAGAAPAAALDAALDARLDLLVQHAQEQPEAARRSLAALSHELPDAPAAQLRFAEGRILVHAGELDAAVAIADALAAQDGMGARAETLRALIAEHQGRNDAAAAAAGRALPGLEAGCAAAEGKAGPAACDVHALITALRVQAHARTAQGELALAVDALQRAQQLAQAQANAFMATLLSGELALTHQRLGQADDAQRWLGTALSLAQGDELAMAHARIYEARVAVRRGDKEGQLRAYQEALSLATRAKAARAMAKIQLSLTDLYMHGGQPRLAIEYALKAMPVVLRMKDARLERTLHHNLGVSQIMQGQFEAARRSLQRAAELAALQSDPAVQATELREAGEAWAQAGQPREAIAVFHRERELSAQINARNREAQLQAAQLKYDSGRKQRDLELLKADRALKDRQLANRELARRVGIAVGVLALLSAVAIGLMLRRVRAAHQRLKANELLLRAQSERDALTELANRRHFLAVMQAQPEGRLSGALLMIDIDHFKHVNDRHGHAAGDLVIVEVARRISHAVRHEDLVVRWGGEEFLVFAPNAEQSTLQLLAERLLFSVGNTPVATPSGPLRVTASIGYAHFPLPPERFRVPWEQAVNWTDKALYTAKAQGRNCAVGIVDVLAHDEAALLQLEADFDAACASERVTLHRIPGPSAAAAEGAAS